MEKLSEAAYEVWFAAIAAARAGKPESEIKAAMAAAVAVSAQAVADAAVLQRDLAVIDAASARAEARVAEERDILLSCVVNDASYEASLES